MARPRNYPYGATVRSEHLTFSAGAACLDFANTRELRKSTEPQEYLHRYDDLLVFAQRVKLLPMPQIELLREESAGLRLEANAVFAEALRLREAIYQTVAAIARPTVPPRAALARIDDHRRAAVAGSEIVFRGGRFERCWRVRAGQLAAITWPIAESIATLLMDEALLSLSRECHGPDCGWVFLDRSRTRRRRWCNMSACGNRAKAARHYAKRRGKSPAKHTVSVWRG